MVSNVNEFIESLRTAQMPDDGLVNIYSDEHDPHGWRRARLARWLELPRDRGPVLLFIGEAPGVKGAAVTGVPFTSVETLTSPGFERLHFLEGDPGYAGIEGTEPELKERTAKDFWSVVLPMFAGLPLPMVWNAVPFWPRAAGRNATPKSRQRECGSKWLTEVLGWHSYAEVIAVGRVAEGALRKLGVASARLRHPSYGGKREFAQGVRKVVDSIS